MKVRFLGQVDYPTIFQAMQDFTRQRDEDTPDELWLCEHPPTYTLGLSGKAEHIHTSADIPVSPEDTDMESESAGMQCKAQTTAIPSGIARICNAAVRQADQSSVGIFRWNGYIAAVKTDRGGQVTYHGPGQVIAYPLINLRRRGYFVKSYVYRLEEALIRCLNHFGVTAHRVKGAPGVYVRTDDPFSHALLPKSSANTPNFSGLAKIAALGIKVSRDCTYHGVALNVHMDLEPFSRIDPCGYRELKTTDLFTIGVCPDFTQVQAVLRDKLITYLT